MLDSLKLLWGPPGVLAVGGIITVIGAWWSALRSSAFEAELTAKNEEIRALEVEGRDILTGGDSFTYVHVRQTLDQGVLYISQSGLYNVYDLKVEFRDVGMTDHFHHGATAMLEIDKGKRVFGVGLLPRGATEHLETAWKIDYPLNYKEPQEFWFDVRFSARNGVWFQTMVIRKFETGSEDSGIGFKHTWRTASQVFRDGKLVHETIDEEFGELPTTLKDREPRHPWNYTSGE